eukprot:TRINITY_DN84468_c0_g1_i1.p1 TRINITY_DN84468_c0_g1~~TRINITY_DN84468_c0_g1_i1.p1  ORF type:complete len:545 (-),score=76.90 TRINITY_DN84468_c0_g1_i1:53-1687(-)
MLQPTEESHASVGSDPVGEEVQSKPPEAEGETDHDASNVVSLPPVPNGVRDDSKAAEPAAHRDSAQGTSGVGNLQEQALAVVDSSDDRRAPAASVEPTTDGYGAGEETDGSPTYSIATEAQLAPPPIGVVKADTTIEADNASSPGKRREEPVLASLLAVGGKDGSSSRRPSQAKSDVSANVSRRSSSSSSASSSSSSASSRSATSEADRGVAKSQVPKAEAGTTASHRPVASRGLKAPPSQGASASVASAHSSSVNDTPAAKAALLRKANSLDSLDSARVSLYPDEKPAFACLRMSRRVCIEEAAALIEGVESLAENGGSVMNTYRVVDQDSQKELLYAVETSTVPFLVRRCFPDCVPWQADIIYTKDGARELAFQVDRDWSMACCCCLARQDVYVSDAGSGINLGIIQDSWTFTHGVDFEMFESTGDHALSAETGLLSQCSLCCALPWGPCKQTYMPVRNRKNRLVGSLRQEASRCWCWSFQSKDARFKVDFSNVKTPVEKAMIVALALLVHFRYLGGGSGLSRAAMPLDKLGGSRSAKAATE